MCYSFPKAQQNVIYERRQKILDYITAHQKAELSELATHLDTTEARIRRDLIELEKAKLIVMIQEKNS